MPTSAPPTGVVWVTAGPVTVDGKTIQVQVGMNLIVVGSKDVPKTQ